MVEIILEKLEIKEEDDLKTAAWKGVGKGALEASVIVGGLAIINGILCVIRGVD